MRPGHKETFLFYIQMILNVSLSIEPRAVRQTMIYNYPNKRKVILYKIISLAFLLTNKDDLG